MRMTKLALVVALGLTACDPKTLAALSKPADDSADWNGLGVGYIGTEGVSMSGDGIAWASGQTFTPNFAVDCRGLDAVPVDYLPALKKGAKIVTIRVAGERKPYYGIIALCKVHKSAVGPASRSYNVRIPEDRLKLAKGGLISSVGEVVESYRTEEQPNQPISVGALLGVPTQPQPYNGASLAVKHEDFGWILWLTDRGPTFTEAQPQ